jgi:ketosteroid isomerase-like protein
VEERSAEAVVRAIYDAWRQGYAPRHLIAEELEYVNPSDAVETGTRHGRSALAAPFEAYEEFDITPDRYVPVGADRVVVIAKVHIRARESGVEIDTHQGYVWTVRDGRAVRFEWFRHPADALAAVDVEDGAG